MTRANEQRFTFIGGMTRAIVCSAPSPTAPNAFYVVERLGSGAWSTSSASDFSDWNRNGRVDMVIGARNSYADAMRLMRHLVRMAKVETLGATFS